MARGLTLAQRRRHRLPSSSGGLSLGGLMVVFFSMALAVVALGAFGFYVYIAQDLPSPEVVLSRRVAQSTKIYDRQGRLLNEIFDPESGRRTKVPLSRISPYLVQATIATEDADFYTNPGVNLRGLARALLQTVRGDEDGGGGSSITQQLVKNVLIPEAERTQRSLTRKIKEAILAVELSRRYSKDQILEWYLNEIFYGNLSYGVESAAQAYFGKSAQELNLAEAAMLAGLPQAPALYSPLTNPRRAEARQGAVLDLMVRQGFVTAAEAQAARHQSLSFRPQRFEIDAPHFVMYIRELLERKYGPDALYRGGLRVTTTLDLELQSTGETLVRQQVAKLARTANVHNGALVAIRPTTGEILAMVGSADYFDPDIQGQVNNARAENQPGSAFKPFTYVTAFAKGYTPATMLLDVATVFRDGARRPYMPQNVDGAFFGPISAREALANSRNIPAVQAIQFAGVPEVIATAHRMGITTLNQGYYGPALTLGGGDVALLDMTFAYGAFATGGRLMGQPTPAESGPPGRREVEPVALLRVEDAEGRVLEEFTQPEERQVLSPQLAYLITSILSDNAARSRVFGANSALRLSRAAAAKTGTTEDFRDFWIVGYTPDLVTGVWMGNADNTPAVRGTYGSTAAAPLWRDFMEKALDGTPPTAFAVPPGLVRVTVCVPSGLLPTPHCPQTRRELFIQGTEPKQTDNLYQVFRIDRRTGQLATAATPPNEVEEKVFLVLPQEAAEWARKAGIPEPPTEQATSPSGPAPGTAGGVTISSPQAGSFVRGTVIVYGSAQTDEFVSYGLEIGSGLNPDSWAPLGPAVDRPVAAGPLASFDTKNREGIHTLRLTVVDRRQGLVRSVVPITIDNMPPRVEVTYPTPSAVFTPGPNTPQEIMLQAQAGDNRGLARVDFLVDGQVVGSTAAAPYTVFWLLTPGGHTILAMAYDKAGNSTPSDAIEITVR